MATFQPAVSGDDGGDFNAGGFQTALSFIAVGDDSGGPHRAWFRFPNVTVPQGATITSCILQFVAHFSDSATVVNVNVYFQNADNAAAPTSSAELTTALANATAAVAWNGIPAWTGEEVSSGTATPELATILQTVVNRAGWASGNALVLLIDNNGSSTSALRRIRAFDWESGLPTLTITYTEGGSPTDAKVLIAPVGFS